MKSKILMIEWEDASFTTKCEPDAVHVPYLVQTFGFSLACSADYYLLATHRYPDGTADVMRIPKSLVRKVTCLRKC